MNAEGDISHPRTFSILNPNVELQAFKTQWGAFLMQAKITQIAHHLLPPDGRWDRCATELIFPSSDQMWLRFWATNLSFHTSTVSVLLLPHLVAQSCWVGFDLCPLNLFRNHSEVVWKNLSPRLRSFVKQSIVQLPCFWNLHFVSAALDDIILCFTAAPAVFTYRNASATKDRLVCCNFVYLCHKGSQLFIYFCNLNHF